MVLQSGGTGIRAPDTEEFAITKTQLLVNAQAVLTQTRFLSFNLEVLAPPSIKMRAEARMGVGMLRTRFYLKDTNKDTYRNEQLVTDLLIKNDVILETRPDTPDFGHAEAIYATSTPGETANLLLNEDIRNYYCLTASAMRSWVGGNSSQVQKVLPFLVSDGELVEIRIEQGKPCHVVRWNRPELDRIDELYFDARTFLLLRWDTYYTDLGPRPLLSRSRRYRNMSTASLPDETWLPQPDAQFAHRDSLFGKPRPIDKRAAAPSLDLEPSSVSRLGEQVVSVREEPGTK